MRRDQQPVSGGHHPWSPKHHGLARSNIRPRQSEGLNAPVVALEHYSNAKEKQGHNAGDEQQWDQGRAEGAN